MSAANDNNSLRAPREGGSTYRHIRRRRQWWWVTVTVVVVRRRRLVRFT